MVARNGSKSPTLFNYKVVPLIIWTNLNEVVDSSNHLSPVYYGCKDVIDLILPAF